MLSCSGVSLKDVQAVYSGAEGRLWELLMGEQIHIGGLQSSLDLAQQAGILRGWSGVDLCSASGAGMRFLLRFCGARHMTGVDATEKMVQLAKMRAGEEGVTDKVTFVQGNVCATGLPAASYDFIWGEDAWCYVEDKAMLIAEAVRLAKPGGIIAFTDWMEGPVRFSQAEADQVLAFMKFPSLLALGDYGALLEKHNCEILGARDTERFARYVQLYLDLIEGQQTYDALKIIQFDQAMADALLAGMRSMLAAAKAGKIIQGQVVARKKA